MNDDIKLTDISAIKALFEKHGFSFTKSLGQNFLINPSVCPKMAELSGADKSTAALEIGTGIGVLTKELALRCKKVTAVELDGTLEPILHDTLGGFDNVNVIFDDILKVDLEKLFEEEFGEGDVIVCANLPYYITSPVIMKLLESRLPIKQITVMVQLEAAVRICARPGTRESGALTVGINYFSVPKKLFNVSRGSFMPSPNVDSAVISLTPHRTPIYTPDNERLYFDIVKQVFGMRRKQIINPLSEHFGIEKSLLAQRLQSGGIDPKARAEALSMDDFAVLYRIMENLVG